MAKQDGASTESRLSIIIVNWNTCELLRACLRSLLLGQHDDWEAIVVDNASTDASVTMAQSEYPSVSLIRNTENLGFARANNQGIQQSAGRYVLLLNSDTQIPPGALAGLVDFMDNQPDVGACSPQLRTAADLPQAYAFGNDPSLGYLLRRGLNRLLLNRPLHDWDVDHTIDVDWVSGACLLLRREALAHVSRLDEQIFMYFEDVDLCRRIRQRGWRVCYVPQIQITHLGGQSLGQNPQAPAAYQRSLRYYYAKHYGPISRLCLALSLGLYNQLAKNRENLRSSV